MRIGELAKRAGISRDTIRYYERKGLLPVPLRSPVNGYAHYGASVLTRLRLIRLAKRLGFALCEIGPHLEDWAAGRLDPVSKVEALEAKMVEITAAQKALAQRRRELEQQLAGARAFAAWDV